MGSKNKATENNAQGLGLIISVALYNVVGQTAKNICFSRIGIKGFFGFSRIGFFLGYIGLVIQRNITCTS